MIRDLAGGRRVSRAVVEYDTNAAGIQMMRDAPEERMGMLYRAPAMAWPNSWIS